VNAATRLNGTLASQPSCRDKGWGSADEGALCLSWWEGDPSASRNPGESSRNEDKHKAPALPHIRPLSLQDGGGRFLSFPDSVVTQHQDGGGHFHLLLHSVVKVHYITNG